MSFSLLFAALAAANSWNTANIPFNSSVVAVGGGVVGRGNTCDIAGGSGVVARDNTCGGAATANAANATRAY